MSIITKLRDFAFLRSSVCAARNFRSAAIDRWLNIQTRPSGQSWGFGGTRFVDGVQYEPIDYALMNRLIRPLDLHPSDVVYDIGCGMGRALCLLARRRVSRCVGIECVPELAQAAAANAARLRGRLAPIEIRSCDACEADYTDATVFWLFNPFGPKTLDAVLRRIEQSLAESPRRIQIAYLNPVHDAVLRSCSWLTRTHVEQPKLFFIHGSYWSNHAAPGPMHEVAHGRLSRGSAVGRVNSLVPSA